jgi:hypothetical protein
MRAALFLIALFTPALALAEPSVVYKTVDEEGVVSFSDTPPKDGAAVERYEVNVPPPQPTGEYLENLEAMRETTDRMAEDRRAREKHRAELRELAARTEAHQAAAEPQVIEVNRYLPDYVGGYHRPAYRPGYPPWRPGYGPKPDHPIVRPPMQTLPEATRPTQGNSQLMRPITTR